MEKTTDRWEREGSYWNCKPWNYTQYVYHVDSESEEKLWKSGEFATRQRRFILMFLPQGLFFIQTAVWRLQTPKQANLVRFLFQIDFWNLRQRDPLRVYFRVRQELTEALIIIAELVDFEPLCGVLRTSFKAGRSSFFPPGCLPISFLPLPESRGPRGLSRIA